MQYTTSALWTAARYRVPVTFVVCNNRRYRALEEFSRLLHVPEGDYRSAPRSSPCSPPPRRTSSRA